LLIPSIANSVDKIFINLTPLIPLSTLGEGEENFKRGASPLLNTQVKARGKRYSFPLTNQEFGGEASEGGWEEVE